MSNFDNKLKSFKNFVSKIEHYNSALSLLNWDLMTDIPEKGIAARSSLIGLLSSESFQMSTSSEMEEYIKYFSEEENEKQLDEIMKAVLKESKKNFKRYKKIPTDKYREYVELTSNAQSIWEKAKHQNDFELFQPYLEKIIDYNLQFIEYWGYEGNKYNALLNYYEPGMTVEKLDPIFKELKNSIIPLLSDIQASNLNPENPLLNKDFSKEKQEEFCIYLLEEMGFNLKAGMLAESEHPFTINLNPDDVRLTTHYYPDNPLSAIFSSLHEGGHGLYEQNIKKELMGTTLCTGTSMGIHESQSLFWEKMIGRSQSFWKHYFSKLQNYFPEKTKDISLEDFYQIINRVEASFIRVEADELTYNLHIMIRYELEKGLINQEIKVSDLPEIWKQKLKDYLGIIPKTDTEGVLQDVHWSAGLFGYFPSYSLGYIYTAQIYNTARKEIENFDKLIEEGNLIPIKDWLADKIHQHGMLLEPKEIILQVTGEKSNPKYLIKYLEKKYRNVYNLRK
ncbi:carboxypeptidase M32 [Halanaerobiaceae bacterium ANBcell28]